MNNLQKTGIGALIAAGLSMPLITTWLEGNREEEKPVLAEREYKPKDLEETVKGSGGSWKPHIDYDKNEFYMHFNASERLPIPVRLSFENANSIIAGTTKVVLPLQQLYRSQIGDRGFTPYEILQIFGRDTDSLAHGHDIGKITENEVADAIQKLAIKGKSGFVLDLEEPRFKMLENTGKKGVANIHDAYDSYHAAAMNEFNAAGRVTEAARKHYDAMNSYTQRQLDAEWRARTSLAAAEWNARRQMYRR